MLEPLENLVPVVAPVWDDCSLIRMTVSDPLERSGLGVTVHVDMDSLKMAPWNAGGMLGDSCRPSVATRRTVFRSVARLSCRPAFV